MLARIINLKSWSQKCGYALALLGLSLPFASNADALSAGCSFGPLNMTYPNSNSVSTAGRPFEPGETITATITRTAADVTITSVTYNDFDNAANNQGGADGTLLTIGQSKTFNFTVSAATTSAQLNVQLTAPASITLSCAATASSNNNSESTTKSAVVSAVSRLQTKLLQQNIKSRVSSAVGPANNANTSHFSSETPSSGATATDSTSFINNTRYDDENSLTDRDDALRRMAMMGSFDSSTGLGMDMLGLGPTDQENDGDVGGAGGIDGRSALQNTSPFTVWGHGSFASVDSDYVNGGTDNRYDGDVWGYNVGLDYKFADALIAGLSLGYTDTDLTTAFNSGSYQETGWTASPYIIYRPVANLNIVAEAGYGMGDIDVTRDNNTVSGNTESDMWYTAMTTSYRVRPIDTLPASLTPSLAFLAGRKAVDTYRESDGTTVDETTANTRQIKPAIEAAYDFTPTQSLTVTPFLETGLIYDFTDEINDDKTAFNLGGGVRLSDAMTGLNAALEGSYLAGRADYTEYTVGGTVTYGFAISDDQGRELGIITPFFASNLNEYGNQRMRTGFGFDTGRMTSQLALSHMMSVANDDDDSNSSAVEISMSLPF